jgi:6-pyruvoyltetrahydropterin/6-carboxytetrahydropterin synthase
MRVTIRKTFDFDAAHHLPFLPEGHKCRRHHGHTYTGFVEFTGTPDKDGMLVEYGEISKIVDGELDHRDLNEIPGLGTSTTENLVRYMRSRFVSLCRGDIQVTRVRVSESSTTYAEIVRPYVEG